MISFKIALLCLAVAVSQAAIINNELQHGNQYEQESFKEALKNIADRLDKWDAFYVGRLEPRMVGAATSLANLDTNIRNLQERAHIWDTFQLHVSAWNEQIKAMDHKMNIMNEGYNKLTSLDTEVSTAMSPNGSLALIISKMAEIDARIEGIASVETRLSESSTRSILNMLRSLDKKINVIHQTVEHLSTNQRMESTENLEAMDDRTLEMLLRALSAKADSIYGRGEAVDMRHSVRCRNIIAPYRKLSGDVEYLRGVVQNLVGIDSEAGSENKAAMRRRLPNLKDIENSLEDIERSIVQMGRAQDRNVNENERILRRIDRKLNEMAKDDDFEELVEKKFKKIEKLLEKLDDDDSDEDNKRRTKKNRRNDDDDDDDDDDSDDDHNKRRNKEDDDSDDDDDDDNDSRRKNRRDDDDDDSNDTDEDDVAGHNGRRKDRKGNDTDEDDDDSDRKRKRNKNKSKNDNDTDEDDDDDDSNDKNDRRRNRNDDDDDDDDDDDSDDKNNRRRKGNDDDDDDDDDSDDKNHSGRKDKDDDDDDDKSDGNDR